MTGTPTAGVRSTAGIHVEEAGDHGPLLLCLHGIGSSSAAFAHQLAELSAYVRVVAWDAPGYAKSADPEIPLTLDDFADAAAALIRERGTHAHVLGVSWGGVIALRLATRHPELVASLIVADSSPGSGTDAAKANGMRQRAAELAELGPRAFAEARGPRLVSPGAPQELVRTVVDTMTASVRLPGYAYAAESMAAADLRAELASITAPALVLCGDQDRVTGVEAGQVIAGALHKTAYVIVKDAGHLANQEQPAAFNAWVLSHLRITDRIPEQAPSRAPRKGAVIMPLTTTAYDNGGDLAAYTDSLIATKDSREPDWNTLAFQAKAGDQYRRAQIRYVGSGATGNHEGDNRIIPSGGFTFSNMLLPPGAEGPEHTHHDVEEAFFVLEGQVRVGIHRGKDEVEYRTLGYRDMIVVPAGVARSLKNEGDTDALFCVVIGTQKPQVPTYPEHSPMHGVTRD